jgi:hypothetical protein
LCVSLVVKVQGPVGESRFGLLESIREYLLEQLSALGELDEARRQNAQYYLELAERTYSEITKENRNSWFDLLEMEHNNIRVALRGAWIRLNVQRENELQLPSGIPSGGSMAIFARKDIGWKSSYSELEIVRGNAGIRPICGFLPVREP